MFRIVKCRFPVQTRSGSPCHLMRMIFVMNDFLPNISINISITESNNFEKLFVSAATQKSHSKRSATIK